KWIFTSQEADLASQMKLRGETVEEIAERLLRTTDGLEELLETMDKKGQIRAWNSSTGRRYALIPFAVGIYEEQLERMDPEFSKLVEKYFIKGRGKGLFDTEPAIFKVIPVNRSVETDLEVYPYQVAEDMVESAKSWGVRDCICKKQQSQLDNECKYPLSVCMIFSSKENAFDSSHLTKTITKEKSLQILREAEESGLVHCSMNIQEGHSYICNCCTCCCNVLRAVSVSGQPHAFVNSDYIMHVNADACTGCEACLERCQFEALSIPDDICEVEGEKCVGCGVCAVVCPTDALSLINREGERIRPPEKFMDWMTQKAISRNVDPSDLL
ncbi:MAG: ATP-binding protein, partial [Candidatus Thorarchaeota archaeon]